MVEEGAHRLLEAHHPGRAGRVEHIHVERDARLQIARPEQRFHQHIGIDIARLGLEDETDRFSRFLAHIGQQRQLLLFQQLGDTLDQPGFRHHIRDLGDDDLIGAERQRLFHPACAQPEAATARHIGLADILRRLDQHAAGREIGAQHMLQQILAAAIRLLHDQAEAVDEFAQIMRRDAGRHADGDARGAIGQQVGQPGRQHDRLLAGAVIAWPEIDRVVGDAIHQRLGDRGQPALRVTHGRGVIAVDIAEIALAVDQRIALREILRQAHQRLVDRLIAMRMIVAHHVADDLGAFAIGGAGIEPQLAHRPEQPAMHRLQPVAHIRQRARHDGRQRVGQIALRQRVIEFGIADLARAAHRCHAVSFPDFLRI